MKTRLAFFFLIILIFFSADRLSGSCAYVAMPFSGTISSLSDQGGALQGGEKPDFKAVWKKSGKNAVINIVFIGGARPLNCYIYDSSPFTGGKLLKQVENITAEKIEIEMDGMIDVYICVVNQEDNLAAKWLRSGK